jgi:hypothetical protein
VGSNRYPEKIGRWLRPAYRIWARSILAPTHVASSRRVRALSLLLLASFLFASLRAASPVSQNAEKKAQSVEPPPKGANANLKAVPQTPGAAPSDHLTANPTLIAATPSEVTPAAHQIEIGQTYENQDRLADAEKAYAKALESASGAEREMAKKCLSEVLTKEEGFRNKYVRPSLEEGKSGLRGLAETFLLLAVLWIVGKMVRRVGEHFGKNKLQIGQFVDATGEGGAVALTEVLKNAVERVQEYYKPRDRFRLGSVSSLIIVDTPHAEELVELVTEVVSSTSGKLVSFFTKGFFRPQYTISGMVQKSGFRYSFWIKLVHKGSVIEIWEQKFRANECPESPEQLAFEVAMYLKDWVELNGN